MHRQVRTALLKRQLQLFNKQTFAADLGQTAVQDLIAMGAHAQEGHGVAQTFEQGFDVFGLPEGQTAFAGGNGQVQGGGKGCGHKERLNLVTHR